jgi:hypothetical protein
MEMDQGTTTAQVNQLKELQAARLICQETG